MKHRDTSTRPAALWRLAGVLLLLVLLALPILHFTASRGAAAGPVFTDGFESGDLAAWTTSGGLAVEGSQAHDGTHAAQANTTDGRTYAKKLLPATYADGYARIYFNILSSASQVNLLHLRTAADGSLAYLFVTSAGKLGFTNSVSPATVTSATSVGRGWHALELHALIGTAGQTEVWLDGVRVDDLSLAANLGTTPIGKVQIGEVNTGATYNVLYDSVVFDVQRIGPVGSGGTPTSTPVTRAPSQTPTNTPKKTSVPPTATTAPQSTPAKTPVPPASTPSGTCSAVTLSKGPTLILTGNNTQMKVFWQWTANSSFTLRWGADTTYSQGSAAVSAYDSTNHLYAYTLSGLTPGAKYYYQVATGSQCTGYSFYAPPPASATGVKFTAYGDTRTNGSVHNGLAGQVVTLFQGDAAFQTLNLNVGDWVSGDSESAWSGEWYNTSYTNLRTQEASLADTGVRGNHEGAATYWKRYFPAPWQAGGLYRSFDYGPMHIALLDQYTSYNAGSAQYTWLKNDLAASTKTWKFVVLHEPGWSSGGGHGNNTTVQTDLEPLFKQYGVSIVFGGHNHYYARAVVDNIQHLTVGGGGAPLYTPASGYPNVVKTSQSYSFGEFSIAGNTLTAKIVNSSGGTIETWTISR